MPFESCKLSACVSLISTINVDTKEYHLSYCGSTSEGGNTLGVTQPPEKLINRDSGVNAGGERTCSKSCECDIFDIFSQNRIPTHCVLAC